MNNIKRFLADDTIYFSLLIILVAVTSYGLGKHAVNDPVAVSAAPVITFSTTTSGSEIANQNGETQVVASKNGSKYHYVWCPGANQMKEENKVYFDSIEAAQVAGYTPAANCAGLE